MHLKYLRVKIFWQFMGPFAAWARRRRMRRFVEFFNPSKGMTVIDLGGQPMTWDIVTPPLDITIVNLHGIAVSDHPSAHALKYISGDACDLKHIADKSFEVAFSNSVIEHVGSGERQAAFAKEARRLGRAYWIQTPSKWFPVEAHCGMPFWWFYPEAVQSYFIRGWNAKLPDWAEMIQGTTVLTKSDLKRLFPEAEILTERFLGIPKSYIVCFIPSKS